MSLNLPEPDALDVWGTQLNTAIQSIETQVTSLAATVATLQDQISGGGDTSAFVTKDMIGTANGVAALDSAKFVVKTQLANVSPQDIGAAYATHQHTLADLPAVSLLFQTTPAIARFNTATSAWPTRASITTVPTRPVIWWGDAAIPADAKPGIDLDFTVKSSGTTVPTPVIPAPPNPSVFDANGVKSAAPTVTVSGTTYTMSAVTSVNATRTFPYFQFVVRGPNGEAQDTSFSNGLVINSSTPFTLTGSGVAPSTGNWTVDVGYSLDGTNWTEGAKTTFAISSSTGSGAGGSTGNGTPGSGLIPKLGRSGLTYNSGVCDRSNANPTDLQTFANWRGRQLDSTMFFAGRGSWSDLTFLPDGLTTFPGYRVIAISTQPEPNNNDATASGANNQHWIDYGKALAAKGWNDGRTILRLNWEANGNWYAWSWGNGGGASAFVNAIKNTVTSIRANAPLVKIDVCVNRGSINSGINWQTQIMDPLIGYIDIIGLDWYDFSPAQTNDTVWNQQRDVNPGFTPIANYCRSKGLLMSLDEWGVCSAIPGYTAGGDSPYWINKMFGLYSANADVVANEMYFNINADNLYQQLYPIDTKPNSSAAYKAR